MKQKIIKFISVLILACIPLSSFAQTPEPGFNPSKLIEDKVFSDTQTFGGPEGIQKFLESKNSVLAITDPSFLIRLKEPQVTILKQALEDPRPNLDRLRTAAELIWDASVHSGLNPQIILVTLNKEQSLISRSDPNDPGLQRALDYSMGFACPDSGGCGSLFPGFYYQLFGNLDSEGNRYLGAAKSLMKSFSTPNGRGPQFNGQIAKVGDTITLENTLGGYEGVSSEQTITLSNNATAALYRYTPHVFNGNYNFWKFFIEWFRYPNGSLLKLANSSEVYIIQNGLRQLVPQFVATARALNLNNVITVSSNEIEQYSKDKLLGPANNTIVQVSGDNKKYVFLDNIKHLASDLVLKQRGLNPESFYNLAQEEFVLFETGDILTPTDGTIVRGKTLPAVYLVEGGKIKLFTAYTFQQRKIPGSKVVLVPDEEISTYAQNGFVAPLDGTLVKSQNSPTVYFIQKGLKQAVLGDIFKIRGFNFKKVAILSAEEVDSLPNGGYAEPKDRTYFSVDSKKGQVYVFKDGTKHSISTFVAKQRGMTPDYVFSFDIAATWPEGIPVAPRDGTIIKGDSDPTVYLVAAGQLKPLTYQAYINRKITAKKIILLPQTEVEAYAKGEAIIK